MLFEIFYLNKKYNKYYEYYHGNADTMQVNRTRSGSEDDTTKMRENTNNFYT